MAKDKPLNHFMELDEKKERDLIKRTLKSLGIGRKKDVDGDSKMKIYSPNKHILLEERLGDPKLKRPILCVKIRAHIKAAKDPRGLGNVFDRALESPAQTKLSILKTLIGDVLELMKLCTLTPSSREREAILVSIIVIGESFNQYKKQQWGLTMQDMGLTSIVQLCVDSLYNNYVDCETHMGRYEFVYEIFATLKSNEVLHFALEALIVSIKSALRGIYRLGINTHFNGIVNMIDMDVTFTYFELVEQILAKITSISHDEVFNLKSIERTSTHALRHPLIVFNAARIATLAESRFNDLHGSGRCPSSS